MRDAIPVCGSVDQCICALARDAVDRVAPDRPEEYGDAFLEWSMRWVGRLGDTRRGHPCRVLAECGALVSAQPFIIQPLV